MTLLRRALLSVSAKEGIVDLGRGLAALGVEVISTGGTARVLREAGVPVVEVSDYTGSPEILDGRVKTLHPKVHAGILARRDRPDDLRTLEERGYGPIDLVAVNLYPFEAAAARADIAEADLLEQIDIGGPTLVRAAAKSWPHVVVLVDPEDYGRVLDEIANAGTVRPETRRQLAIQAFRHTARYDAAIAARLAGPGLEEPEVLLPAVLPVALERHAPLRYGENPHQEAALYRLAGQAARGLAAARVVGGKELSFNNCLDLEAAHALVLELAPPAAVIVKHAAPCGAAASAPSLADAARAAIAGDPVSAYGGVVGLGAPVDAATAEVLTEPDRFFEVIVAPAFEPAAVATLTTRRAWGKNVRLVEMSATETGLEIRSLGGTAVLVQRADSSPSSPDVEASRPATSRAPTPAERRDLAVAWASAKYLRSNAIAIAKDGALVGACGGQPSRVEAVRIALERAGDRAAGASLASDAFFPFPDSIDLAARARVAAIVHPGGSKRDPEVIAAAERAGMAMLLTGIRHFRH